MAKNKVLIIGSGGREHAIATFVSQSPQVEKIFCAPGNGGTSMLGESVLLNIKNHDEVVRFISEKEITLTIIGPEAPLVEGLADDIRAHDKWVVGAGKKAAQLEGSKLFAKEFMAKFGIPTAPFRMFDDPQKALNFAQSREGRTFKVLKADGLAAGKGVFVTETLEEMKTAIDDVMVKMKFGDAGKKIILEEKLEGPEVSVMGLTDGKTLLPFPASQDHKRAWDGDKGPNTGGMGAYSPTPFYDDHMRQDVQRDIVDNFLRGLKSEKLDFRGVIYFGIMMTKKGPQVLEFNVRLGDPEAQIILPLVDSDLFDAFLKTAQGKLSEARLTRRPGAACTVVVTSGGYPGKFSKGFPIQGLKGVPRENRVYLFHAGTQIEKGKTVTSGGRVLNVTGVGKNLETALVRAYQGVKKIYFKNQFFRQDIGHLAIKDKSIFQKIKKMRVRKENETELTKI